MFPSLKNIESARMARFAILNSKVDFVDWNFKKALRYLYVIGGKELLRKAGLARVAPKWKGERDDLRPSLQDEEVERVLGVAGLC